MVCPLGHLFKKRNSHFLAGSAGRYTTLPGHQVFDETQLKWISKLIHKTGHSEFQSKMEQEFWMERLEGLIDKTGPVWRCLECGRCGEDSRAKANLRRHVETHIEGICLPCNLCGHTSKSSNGLKQHIAKKHTQPKLSMEERIKAEALRQSSINDTPYNGIIGWECRIKQQSS